MNKSELIDALAEKTGLTKVDLNRTLDAVLETIEEAVASGEKVLLVGFGVFEVQHRAARTGRNPQTGASIQIAASTTPKFVPGKPFKDRVAAANAGKA